ncbi:MAG: MlaD family protein [Elainella sp. Prado103]|jgi:phospholipid/cholesterol/gamma-HCH transport system substrate-binding protein|nr:MlaD family protein [Elainella sp. Prado103]
MRSRTVREGSVGLVILLGLAVFSGLFLWLRGFSLGRRSYLITIQFPNVEGMQIGAPVLYRGVAAGKISAIRVNANYAEVDVKIAPADIVMPRDVTIEARQSGLVGETFIDITPNIQLSDAALASHPLANDCNEELIICNGSALEGTASVTFTELLSSMINFTNTFSSPEFFGELRTLTRNFASAAAGVDTLASEVTVLSQSVRGELGTLSASASNSANSIGLAATQLGGTAQELESLIASNRVTLTRTLDNLNETVSGVSTIVNTLAPAIEEGEFLANLETLSANAAEASHNLRNLSGAVGNPETLLLLQQTLDSARSTFQNAQKITADLDELTGDPGFRENIRRLVNGLGGLVSSAQELQQETQLARVLASTQLLFETQQLDHQNATSTAASSIQTDAAPPDAKPPVRSELPRTQIGRSSVSNPSDPSAISDHSDPSNTSARQDHRPVVTAPEQPQTADRSTPSSETSIQ